MLHLLDASRSLELTAGQRPRDVVLEEAGGLLAEFVTAVIGHQFLGIVDATSRFGIP